MSEYQYYEFQAIHRPLTNKEIRVLRSYSSRARITPTRFVNEYEWGSFKGDEDAWIDKAEADFVTAQMSYRARRNPNHDAAACFHAQLCAEKYLKARLEEAGLAVSKTHNLYGLLRLVLPTEPTWNVLAADQNVLSTFTVAYRYPGISATRVDAKDAIRRCRKLRRVARKAFGLLVK